MPDCVLSPRVLRYGAALILGSALLTLLALAGRPGSVAASAPQLPGGPPTPAQYFPQTGHQVGGPLLDFYRRAGGFARFGAPLTEAYDEGGIVAQVFERGALQWDRQAGTVTPRPLGADLVAGHAPAPPVLPGNGSGLFVAATGHVVGPAFLAAWQGPDGAARLGNPITEQQDEWGHTVQYFEFARLTVDAGAPGGIREQLQDNVRRPGSPFAPTAGPRDPAALFIAATGHSIGGGFREIYGALGGGPSLGAPLTDEVLENGLTVQYFTAAKLSYTTARPAGALIQVEALGRDWMTGHSVPPLALLQAPPPSSTPAAPGPTLTPAIPVTATAGLSPTVTVTTTLTPAKPAGSFAVPAGWALVAEGQSRFQGSSPARITNIVVAAKKLDGVTVPAGGVFSFNRSLGDDSEKAGFVEGLIIYNGHTIPGVGGGICQVASTFFRAAFFSGFDILERHPHSYRVSWYEPPVGIDATVYRDEGVDLRWRNNLAAPVLLHTIIDRRAGTLTVQVYSRARQSFTVSLDGPYTAHRIPHGPALYEDDPTRPAGTVTQVEHAKDGLDVTVYRVLTDRQTGRVIRRDRFFSRYAPWRDVFKRGTGHGQAP
ncbi:MAG TPA: VanW family protein [Chloroflexia bacterium]|nr:VanW family protein [Chloroflexia bacterium]